MSGLILHLSISQSHVFLLNSRLGLFTAASPIAWRKRPFSRSYRAILPSSLAVIHSSTLGFSPRPPVSVCGTGGKPFKRLAGFLGSLIRDDLRARGLGVLSGFVISGVLHDQRYNYALKRTIPSVRRPFTSPSPHRYDVPVLEY